MPTPVAAARVHALLLATLSPVPAPAAEAHLRALNLQPGFIPALFSLATTHAPPVALAAAVYLKNLVRTEWAIPPCPYAFAPASPTTLPPADVAFLRDHLVPAMAPLHHSLRTQFAQILKRIVGADFPLHYPRLVNHVLALLYADAADHVEAGLVALRAVAAVYQAKIGALANSYRSNQMHQSAVVTEDPSYARGDVPDLPFMYKYPRAAINYVVAETFPRLRELMGVLEGVLDRLHRGEEHVPLPEEQAFRMQKRVCKIFQSVCESDLPLVIVSDLDTVFAAWLDAFLNVLRRPVARARGEVREWPAWQAKHYAARIVYRIFQRYGNTLDISPCFAWSFEMDVLTKFGDFFRTRYAPAFALVMFEIVRHDHDLISPSVANTALLYLEYSVSPGITYKVIKPRLSDLTTKVIFPYLCFRKADLVTWVEDPVEYVRKTYDVLEDFHTPRAAACSLLNMLSRQRRSAVVAPLLAFVVQIMDRYAEVTRQCQKAGAQADPQLLEQRRQLACQKDGALVAIGTIRDNLVAASESMTSLSGFLNTYVLPEFDSDVPFLRERACWLYGQLTAWCEPPVELMLPGLSGLEKSLRDPEFPVRVRAAVDIRHYLRNERAAAQIKPNVADLLKLLFTLLDDIDNTDLVATIDQVILRFGDDIVPFALELCSRLVKAFSRTASAEQGDDEACYAATQCLHTLDSIVATVSLSNLTGTIPLLAEIERMTFTIFDRMFDDERMELFEDTLGLLATFVHYSGRERGFHLRECAEAGVEPHKAVLGLPATPDQEYPLQVVVQNSVLRQAVEADALKGRGAVSPALWSFFPRAMHAFHEWAHENCTYYIHFLQAYLSRSPRVFMVDQEAKESPVQLLLGMISFLWDGARIRDLDCAVTGSYLVALFLQHSRHLEGVSIDREIAVLSQLLVREIRAWPQVEYVVAPLLRSLSHLLYISPIVTLTAIDKVPGCMEDVFTLWVSRVRENHMDWWYDRRCSAIALTSILGSDWNSVPSSIRQSIPELLRTIVQILDVPLTAPSQNALTGVDENIDEGSVGGPLAGISSGSALGCLPGADIEGSEGDGDDLSPPPMNGAPPANRSDDGEDLMFSLLREVDELLFFESVIQRLPPSASQQLERAIPMQDNKRVQCTLHRAAELRRARLIT